MRKTGGGGGERGGRRRQRGALTTDLPAPGVRSLAVRWVIAARVPEESERSVRSECDHSISGSSHGPFSDRDLI